MPPKLMRYNILIMSLLFSIYISSINSVHAATGNEVVTADQPEYTMGDTATITGEGFDQNHLVIMQVIRADGSIVTGDGTETPGSDVVMTDPYGAFTYTYLVSGGPPSAYAGTLTVNVIDTFDSQVLATTSFLDNPSFLLQGCSRDRGDCNIGAGSGWAIGMEGSTSGNVKGYLEEEDVPYRLRATLRNLADAGTYFITNEHDNLRDGIPGVDNAHDFYVGAGPDVPGLPEGTLTKTCVFQTTRDVGDDPSTSKPCIVTGPTYTDIDDDGDSDIDEDSVDGIDNDGDNLVDEDPPRNGGSTERRIQYTWAVLFHSSEAGDDDKKWGLYWKAHLGLGSSGYPGSSLHGHTNHSGNQNVPVSGHGNNQSADLKITKSDSPDPVLLGQNVTYTITVTNKGPATATGTTVTDNLPSSVTYVSATPSQGSCSRSGSTVTCNLGSLVDEASATITIVVTPTVAGSIKNKASVTSNKQDPNTSNNSDSESTLVTQLANLSITKVDSPDPVQIGQNLTYTLTATNGGPSTATGVLVTDNLPSGLTYVSATPSQGSCTHYGNSVSCSLGNMTNGATATVTIVATVNSTGTLTNTASVTGCVSDPNTSNNSSTTTTTSNPSANLSIIKTDSPDPVTAGGTLAYTLTISNAGPSTASGLTVTDTLPAGVTFVSATGTGWTCNHSSGVVTCTRSSLSVGTAPVITITVTAPTTGGTITNTASVTSGVADPNTSNNSASASTTVNPSANLSITKTDSPDPVTAGGTLTYTLTVSNAGPSTATGVSVTDTLPAGVTFVSASGTGWTCNQASGVVTCTRSSLSVGAAPVIIITVTAPASGGTITNTASVTSGVSDPNTGDNSASASTTVNPSANLSITKTDSPDPVTAGQNLTYTLTVSNAGPSTATGVTVTDTLPGGVTFVSATPSQGTCSGTSTVTCNLGSLSNGASATVTIVVTPTASGTLSNTASVTSGVSDPNTGNNSSTASTTVNPAPTTTTTTTTTTAPTTTTTTPTTTTTAPVTTTTAASTTTTIATTTTTIPGPNADVSITKADFPDPVPSVGQNLTYTITVTNNGPATATGVVMTDTLPSTVSWISTNTTQGSCSGTSTVTCNLGTLANGASAGITIVVMTGPPAGMIGNTASVSALQNDPDTANNSVLEATNVGDVSRLINISTRGPVLNSPNLMHGGFVFGGNIPKTLLIRGRGPSIGGAPYFVPGTMSNPKIELYSGQTMIAQNDNWQTTNPQCDSPLIECFGTTEIVATGKDPCQPFPGQSSSPPGCAQEAVLLVTLPPGPYTVIMSGVAGSTGVGIIEVFDPDSDTLPKLANISTRGTVLTSPNFMHGGFIIGAGTGNKTVLIRGRGPALAGSPFFVPGTLSNPKIELYSGSTVIAQNDNWQTTNPQCDSPAVSCGNAADIVATGRDSCQPFPGETSPPPGCAQEAAILVTLPPGPYTVIMSGVGAATGTGLIEVFELGD